MLLIAARLLCSRPADGLRFMNRGVSGQTLRDLCSRWEQEALALRPTVISVLVGINDIGQQVRGNAELSPAQFERDYRALLQRSREFDAVFIPLQSHFDTAAKRAPAAYWIYDGIHPTAAGHQLIADAWLRATEEPTRFRQEPVG